MRKNVLILVLLMISASLAGCVGTDDDADGVMNDVDLCPNTPTGETVDADGCSQTQLDDDGDGVMNDVDICPLTPAGETVDADGCSQTQLDDDGDGVMNSVDLCPLTPAGETVDADGCSQTQLDDDGDGVMNDADLCLNTPTGETVDADGCSQTQLDDDNDGVMNSADLCPNTQAYTGILYGTAWDGTNEARNLVSIDTTSGLISSIGALPTSAGIIQSGSTFGGSDFFYIAWDEDTNDRTLIHVSLANGFSATTVAFDYTNHPDLSVPTDFEYDEDTVDADGCSQAQR
jgi:hypothetical protein